MLKSKHIPIFSSIIFMSVIVITNSDNKKFPNAARNIRLAQLSGDIPIKRNLSIAESYGKMPLYFISNKGQVDREVLYYAKTRRYFLWMTKTGILIDGFESLNSQEGLQSRRGNQSGRVANISIPSKNSIIQINFVRPNENRRVMALEPSEHKVNYFYGRDPSGWMQDIPTTTSVLYKDIFTNIDFKIYGYADRIECDWQVKPGAKVEDIQFQLDNVKEAHISDDGNLKIKTEFGELVHSKPISHQIIDGKRVPIESEFKIVGNNIFGLTIGDYDRNRDLIIDPQLSYSTYLGGGGADYGYGIALDNNGSAYVTGYTSSINFPLHFPYQRAISGNIDVFVCKLTPEGNGLVYSTFLGGYGDDYGYDIAIDTSGAAYITGSTTSSDFPLKNALQPSLLGSSDAFITKIAPEGNQLLFSTFLGGSGTDSAHGIAVGFESATLNASAEEGDGSPADWWTYGNALTQESGWSKETAHTGTRSLKIYNPGTALAAWYGASITFENPFPKNFIVGGWAKAESVESGGIFALDFYIEFEDGSATWYYDALRFANGTHDWQKVESTLSFSKGIKKISPYCLLYDTTGTAWFDDIYVKGDSGTAYIIGETSSNDFSLAVPFQDHLAGESDVFIAKLTTSGDGLHFSTYLGGTGADYGEGIAIDPQGRACITGYTASDNFPLKNPYQNHRYPPEYLFPEVGYSYGYEAFISKLSAEGNSLIYSTYLGGTHDDKGKAIATDAEGSIYVAGWTNSWDFPTYNAFQIELAGKQSRMQGWYSGDAFICKLKPQLDSWSFSTYFGGELGERGNGIAVDYGKSIYVAGVTENWGFPTYDPPSIVGGNGIESFLSNFLKEGNALIYSFPFGGYSYPGPGSVAYDIAIDSYGSAYVTGITGSSTFPLLNPYQGILGGSYDIFISKFVKAKTPSSITVIRPNGSERYISGISYIISWTFTGPVGPIRIEYSTDAGRTYSVIATGIPNNGSCTWTVPYTISPNCLIRISEVDNSDISDVSDGCFSIESSIQVITVTSPNGGEIWEGGSSYDITWISSGFAGGNIKIEYSTNNGGSYSTIISSTPNDGLYSWPVPNTPSNVCRIRISSLERSLNDTSDAVFSIVSETGLMNPSMEDGSNVPDYWWTYGNDLTRETGWTSGVAHTGSKSIKIVNTKATSAGWFGEPVTYASPYPTSLTLGGWAKADNVASGGIFALDFYVEFEDGSSDWYYDALRFSAGTHDWQKAESTASFSKGITKVTPYCLLYSTTGTAWFDDLYANKASSGDTGILNPSLENGTTAPDYWWTYGNDLTRETGWTSGVAHTGSKSIKIVNTKATSAGWFGEPVTYASPYPTSLTLGGWAKADNVASGGIFALDFYVEFEDGSSTWYYDALRFSAGTHDWEKAESTASFTKGITKVTPYCLLYSTTGTAWFDDLYVNKVSSSDTGILNPSLENGTTAPDYWWTYGNDLTRETGWTSGVAHTGSKSIKIVNTKATSAGWFGEPVTYASPYPTSLTLGGWAKADNVAGGLFALDFYIEFEDGSSTWYYDALRFSAGTHDWEKAESTASFSKGITKVTPYCLLYSTTGTAWFDDLYANKK